MITFNFRRHTALVVLAVVGTLSTMNFLAKKASAITVEHAYCRKQSLISKVSQKSLNYSIFAEKRRRLRVVIYFSDASYTTRVGRGIFRCNGRAELSGQSTPYSKEVLNEPCTGDEPA